MCLFRHNIISDNYTFSIIKRSIVTAVHLKRCHNIQSVGTSLISPEARAKTHLFAYEVNKLTHRSEPQSMISDRSERKPLQTFCQRAQDMKLLDEVCFNSQSFRYQTSNTQQVRSVLTLKRIVSSRLISSDLAIECHLITPELRCL